MAISHNVYIRGLNAIYLQAEGVTTPSEIKDFLTFCQIWIEVVHHHHHIEEELFFPGVEKALEQKGIMSKNLEQHKSFETAMEDFGKYVKTAPSGYSGKELKHLVNRFGKPLVDHLHEEITSLLDIQRQFDPKGAVLKTHYLRFEKELVAQSSLVRYPLI
jgi:hemerythrin-like domain-containing protein